MGKLLYRRKDEKNHYLQRNVNTFFWRTYNQKEIDLIEETGGRLYAFEFKWQEGKNKGPGQFMEAYPGSEYQVINRENYLEFIL